MSLRNTDARWGWLAQLFHWLIFLLILGAWFAIETKGDFPKGSPERGLWMGYHKAFGLSVFLLVWVRLGWRLSCPVPRPLIVSPWQDRVAQLVHWGLYAIMIFMPLTGLLNSQFGGRPVSWFGVFEIPVLVAENKELAGTLKEVHEGVLWPLLLLLLTVHVLAALWHHFVVKDATLRRMLPWGRS